MKGSMTLVRYPRYCHAELDSASPNVDIFMSFIQTLNPDTVMLPVLMEIRELDSESPNVDTTMDMSKGTEILNQVQNDI